MNGGKCLKCKKPMFIIRTDGIPLCAECERKVLSEVDRVTKIKKPVLVGESRDS